jgi:hypothetical protein
MNAKNDVAQTGNFQINCRQLCFFCAFFIPLGKILEAPRIFAQYAAGDLLLPAFLQFFLQGIAFTLLLFAAAKVKKPILDALGDRIGETGMKIFYFLCCAFFIFSSLLPLLDLDKFCYAAFFDTSPTVFSFTPFFLLSAFLCMKSLKAYGRLFDLSLLLFIPSFLALIIFSIKACDFSNLLPLFEKPFSASLQAIRHTFCFFYDSALFLFLLNGYTYQKGDGKKIGAAFGVGAVFSLLFFALFFGVFGAMAGSEHYAFIKISQFFPSLKTTGRIDLLFCYLLTILLLFYTCLPLQLALHSFTRAICTKKTLLPTIVLNGGLFVFVLFCNNYYNSLYEWISVRLAPIFWVFSYLLPLLILLLVFWKKNKKDGGRVALNKKKPSKKEKGYA